MKKTKLILTAFSVFAIVSTALAFKAAKLNSTVFCGINGATSGSSQCPAIIRTDFVADENGNTFCARNAGQICNIKATTFVQD